MVTHSVWLWGRSSLGSEHESPVKDLPPSTRSCGPHGRVNTCPPDPMAYKLSSFDLHSVLSRGRRCMGSSGHVLPGALSLSPRPGALSLAPRPGALSLAPRPARTPDPSRQRGTLCGSTFCAENKHFAKTGGAESTKRNNNKSTETKKNGQRPKQPQLKRWAKSKKGATNHKKNKNGIRTNSYRLRKSHVTTEFIDSHHTSPGFIYVPRPAHVLTM